MRKLKKLLKEADKVTKNVFDAKFTTGELEVKFHDVVILGLLEDMIGKTSSLIMLIENNSYNGLDGITRMIFENYAFLKYILEKNTEKRGISYVTSIKLKEGEAFDRYIEQSSDGRKIRERTGISREKFIEKFPKYNDENYRRSLEEEYKSNLNNPNVKAAWYNEEKKIKNFSALCTYLSLDVEYNVIYRSLSNEIHAKDSLQYFKFKKNIVEVMKRGKNLDVHIDLISVFIMEITRSIYGYYKMSKELNRYNTNLEINSKYVNG